MNIPAEFADIFRGVELTEREVRFLDWLAGWDNYTMDNFRSVLQKVRAAGGGSALSELQIELTAMRGAANSYKAALNDLRAQWDMYGGDVGITAVLTELEQVKRLYQSEKEDFIEFACSGIPNLSPFCFNRHPDCVDERGWCKTEKCRGFSRERRPEEG